MPGSSRRLVVVDNDPDALSLAVLDLELEGHQILATASNGADAIAAVDEHQPEVLVIDHRMAPGPHGVDVAEVISERSPDVAIVVFSNYQSTEIISRSERTGATFVPKGNLRSLRRAVEHARPTRLRRSRG